MRDKLRLRTLLGAVGAVALALAGAPLARASTVTFPLTVCDLSSGCTTGTTYGKVTVSDLTGASLDNGVQVTLTLNDVDSSDPSAPSVFAMGGAGRPIMFDLTSGTVSSISDPLNTVPNVSFAAASGTMHDDGTGTWTDWINCSGTGCGSGTSSRIPAELTFEILGSGISTTHLPFALNTPNGGMGGNLYFGTDIGIPSGMATNLSYNSTGDVGAPSEVPLPPAGVLLGSALLLGALLLMLRSARWSTSLPVRLAA